MLKCIVYFMPCRIEKQLKKVESSHKIKRWKSDDEELLENFNLACAKSASDCKVKLHKEAVQRQLLVLLKKKASMYFSI